MDFSFASLFSTLLISSLGAALFFYGKATQKFAILGVGVVLSVLPFFVTNPWILWPLTVAAVVPLYTLRHSL